MSWRITGQILDPATGETVNGVITALLDRTPARTSTGGVVDRPATSIPVVEGDIIDTPLNSVPGAVWTFLLPLGQRSVRMNDPGDGASIDLGGEVPVGTPVPESEAVLLRREWQGLRVETADAVAAVSDGVAQAQADAAAALELAQNAGASDASVADLIAQGGSQTQAALAPLLGATVKLSRYAKADGTDQAANVQAAITTAMSAGVPLDCDVAGTISLGSGITIGDTRANSPQRSILTLVGDLKVKALASMERLVTMQGTVTTEACNIEADGAGKASFAVYCQNYGRATFGRIYASGGLTSGIAGEPSGNNNAFTISKLRVTGSGSKWTGTATLSARSAESGWASTGDTAPYSTWTLATPLPAALAVKPWAASAIIFADGRYMQIRRVVDASTIEVLNEDRAVGTGESVTIIGAAINFPYYGDVGVWQIGAVDVRDNPNAAALCYGGYGGEVGTWAQQNNHTGVLVLKKAMGLTFGHFYTELSGGSTGTAWLVVRDVPASSIFIGPGTNSTPTAWQGMSSSWMSMTGRNKQPLHWTMHKASGSPLTMPPAVPIDAPELNPGTRNLTPGTVQAYRRASGNFALRIDNTYTSGGVGVVKLAAPQGGTTTVTVSLLTTTGGHTIEGAATWSMPVAGEVTLAYWLESTTWRVRTVGTPQDTITSISAAPSRVGQIAVVSGVIYMAAGTTATSDWKQIS